MPSVRLYLRANFWNPTFRKSESPLTIPLGRGVSGDAFVADIQDMRHLTIAGATGAGKVCSV